MAATAEVLATIVNTVGWQKGLGDDATTQRNIATAAREELIHYQVLKSLAASSDPEDLGAGRGVREPHQPAEHAAGRRPDLHQRLPDRHPAFASAGATDAAVYSAEIMGVEAVHRALARQSLGLLGNDRAFMKYPEGRGSGRSRHGPARFHHIGGAVPPLRQAGFGFGKQGATPGAFYDFATVLAHTPDDADINTRKPVAS